MFNSRNATCFYKRQGFNKLQQRTVNNIKQIKSIHFESTPYYHFSLSLMMVKRQHARSQYQTIRKIGQGQHGAVYLVEKLNEIKPTGKSDQFEHVEEFYAMKKIPLSNNYFDFQAKFLLSLTHPNVIQVNQVYQQKQFIVLILELAEQGDLHQYIKRNFYKKVPQPQVTSWLCQLCLGLYYLHNENNIIHRDIKSRNILIKENGLLKFADFGVAKKLQKGQDFARTSVGTPCYLSPESINLGKYDNKSDVWSLGCLMYEICTGQKPFQGQSLGALLHNIVNNQFGELPPRYSPELRHLITSMLEKDPLKRPNILTLLQDPLLKKEFKILKEIYTDYQKISYPEEGPKTTKYLDIDDRKLNCLKIFSESLKTTKNERSIKLEVQEKNSGSDSSLNTEKQKQLKRIIKISEMEELSKISFDTSKIKISERKILSQFFQTKQSESYKGQAQKKKTQQFRGPVPTSSSMNKVNSSLQLMQGMKDRKVEREKFLDKSLKAIIANRTKDKVERNAMLKKE